MGNYKAYSDKIEAVIADQRQKTLFIDCIKQGLYPIIVTRDESQYWIAIML